MKLINLFAARPWPDGATNGVQAGDGCLLWFAVNHNPGAGESGSADGDCADGFLPSASHTIIKREIAERADDWQTTYILKEQWMEATSPDKQGAGGQPLTTIEALEHALTNLKAGRKWSDGLEYSGGRAVPDGVAISLSGGKYRLISTRVINGYTVPAPLVAAPAIGAIIGIEDASGDDWSRSEPWLNDYAQNLLLARGMIHRNHALAARSCKARLGFSPDE